MAANLHTVLLNRGDYAEPSSVAWLLGGGFSNPLRDKGLGPFLRLPGQYCCISSPCFFATGIVCLLQVTTHLSV